jgi:ATP-dependent Zn protease
MTKPLQYIAYHEAGHAVIALRLGYEVGKVTIVRRQGVLGKAEIRNRTSPDDIKINLAGQLAEALVNSNDEQIQLGAHSDWRNTRRSVREFVALGFINGRERGILIDELLQETKALVRRDREAISRVAEALLTRRTLTGSEIKRIMEDVP